MAGRKKVCIICGKERNGIPVKEDDILAALRWFKKNVTRNEKGNRLVVCKECYPKYSKERKRYFTRRNLYIALGVILSIMIIGIAHSIFSVIWGVFVVLFMYLLSLVNYLPGLDIIDGKAKERNKKM